MTDDTDSTDRLDRLESLVERQAETIETLREQVSRLTGQAEGDTGIPVSRRTALQAGGLLALLGVGAGAASADPQGQVGTQTDPVATLYVEELAGGITGGTTVSNLTGSGLDVQGGALAVPEDGIAGLQIDLESIAGRGLSVEVDRLRSGGTALPRYDAVGDDPAAVVDAMAETFTAERTWADSDPSFGYRSGPAHGEGGNAFSGAVVAPTGEVIFAPHFAANVGVYDPVSDTYTRGASHSQGAAVAFRGAAVAPTGEVVFAPFGSPNVGVVTTNGGAISLETALHPLVNNS